MEIIFFTGKGGVGKSTSSALFAYKLAKTGKRVLLNSIDPAHNLHDIFNCKLSATPKKLTKNLSVMETDLNYWVKKYLTDTEKEFKSNYKYQEAFNLHKYFRTLKYSPGLEEYAVLLALQHTIEKYKDLDYIIFDTPPTALTLKFLALPSVSLLWLEELAKFRKLILEKKDIVTKIKEGKKKKETERDPVMKKIENMINLYKQLRAYFTDSLKTKIFVVMNPDKLSLSESKDIRNKLYDLKLPKPYIILNKFHDETDMENTIIKEFPECDIVKINKQIEEVIGLENLDKVDLNEHLEMIFC